VAAEKLRLWVYQNIVNKNYDTAFADARQTLNSRSGDCTEHAVLLAALTRAVGIPSRVAVGLLYMPDNTQSGRFVYHMWTEIWLGKFGKGEWVPLDATQAEPWVDVGRIKFADSPLNTEDDLVGLTQPIAQWMGQIQIDVFQALTPGQSVLNVGSNRGTILNLDIAAEKNEPLTAVDLRQVRKRQFLRIGPAEPSLLPDSPEALFSQGVEQLGKQDVATATQTFEKVLQRTDNPLALYHLGERLQAVKMTNLASQSFKKAQQQDPQLSGLVSEWQNEMQKAENDIDSLEASGDAFLDQEAFSQAK
jgi:tetratricopeptide (TPR) repeat protein